MNSYLHKTRSILLAFLTLLLWTGTTIAQETCTVSGAGSSDVNGDYTWDGFTTNWEGNPVYEKSSGYPTLYMHANYSGAWVINEDQYDAYQYGYSTYYSNSNYGGDSHTPPASGWSTENGYYPEPTTSCGPQTNPPTPISISSGCWASATAGSSHTIAIKDDGTLWAWGSASSGRLGNGNTTGKEILPVQIGTDTDWTNIYVGGSHSIAMKIDGTLWAWGSNYSGELGLGYNNAGVSVPTQIGTDTDWKTVSLGNSFTLAVKTDGTLWTWGGNSEGQLGNGTYGSGTGAAAPTQIGTDTDWSIVEAGYQHSQGIKTDGTLWGWGLENHGRLGNGNNITGSTQTRQTTPVQIGTDTDWAAVSSGNNHSHALKTDGSLWAWGYGSSGRLGTGNTSNQAIPIQIGTDTDWSIARTGNGVTNFIKLNGTRWACGSDGNGRFGNNISGNLLVPTQIGTDTDWTDISGGVLNSHVVALKSLGELLAWGKNLNGTLGNGFEENTYTPVLSGKVQLPAKGVSKTVTSTSLGNDGDWVYYGEEGESYFFAINWSPDGSLSAANETARDYSSVTLNIMSNYHSSTNGADASFIMGRFWNVDTQGNGFDEPVNIRFYYDPAELTDIVTAADNYSTANSSSKRELQWFKLNSEFNPSSNNSSTFNPDVYLTPSSMGGGSCERNYVQFDGLTSFSGGGAGVGVGAAFAGTPVLPVELLDFTGRLVNDNYVQLDWQTATEINNQGFDVERSQDGLNWERIGYVEGHGNSVETHSYSFDDHTPLNGLNFYRLKQTDFDGTYEYTKIIVVEISHQNNMTLYPNPSKGGELFLQFNEETKGSLTIHNLQGKLVYQQILDNKENRFVVKLPELSHGIYMVQMFDGLEKHIQKLIIE